MEYVNPYFTELTGYSLKEALAVHPSILKSGIHPPELYDELWKTITSGNVWRGQFHNRKKNGEMYWEDATISPITDEKGDIKNYIAIKEDITKRKSLEEQLLQSQKMEGIGRLAGGVAHDFNNILSAIISYAYLAGMDAGDDLKLKHNVDQITVLASRASEITKGLLEFSRKHPYNPAPLNINEKIMSVKKIMNKFLGEDIELNIKLADRYLVIMADTVQIEQIIMNLATNAYDAMNGSGTLSILTEMMTIDNSFIQLNKFGKPGTYAVITVSDTGTGMNKNIKQMIFEPFFTTKEVGKGTGLGLSIVYGIVKQHQGFIHVYSEPGHGTTFKLYFKIADTDAIEQIKEEPIAADLSGHEETILLAEDEEDVRAVETTILQKYNYRVIEAVDGQDAIDKFINNMDMIKLCILDAVMPKKNGKEVIEAIRKNKSNTNIILTSGYAADVISCTGIPKEGLEFLPKPILPDNLLKTVKKVLNN
jgi:PAS domain S-box-containing protein